ncbi:hypothetical protein DVH24_026768 [Malus domestica]|uniref:Uncharacterized protein n=1 Tax=Malus domestica TaxID=3750 RepID=A0A498K494_MALDO|nr:hypothetical protein DVH24_026768 [Malus domestica]
MGNTPVAVSATPGKSPKRHDNSVVSSDPLDEGLGHSFCYIRPDSSNTTLVRGAEPANNDVSVNLRHLRQCQHIHDALDFSLQALPVQSRLDRAAKFESSISFASIPLQPVPRKSYQGVSGLAPIEIGFLSGSIERSYLSSPIDRGMYSGPIEKEWH